MPAIGAGGHRGEEEDSLDMDPLFTHQHNLGRTLKLLKSLNLLLIYLNKVTPAPSFVWPLDCLPVQTGGVGGGGWSTNEESKETEMFYFHMFSSSSLPYVAKLSLVLAYWTELALSSLFSSRLVILSCHLVSEKFKTDSGGYQDGVRTVEGHHRSMLSAERIWRCSQIWTQPQICWLKYEDDTKNGNNPKSEGN